MKATAQGRLAGDHIEVADEKDGQRLHAKGHVGDPLTGGGLRLSRIEAAYAVHTGRLEVEDHGLVDLLAGHRAEVTYLAYSDLRERGLVVRHEGDAFLAWKRGEHPPASAWFRFHAVSERDRVTGWDLLGWAEEEAVVGVVDEDGVVTHYHIEPATPTGDAHDKAIERRAAHLLEDRVLVPGAADLAGDAHIGTPHGDDLLLSLTEAEALRRRGVLDLPDDLPERAEKTQHHFRRTLPVYEALRAAGVVAKSGFRFGTHLRGYRADPDAVHAEWLIQCAHEEDVLHWSEISRAVRLAHGVRKSFLVAVGEPVRFCAMSWFRP